MGFKAIVTIIRDRYGIHSSSGSRISCYADEIMAFEQINDMLRRHPTLETVSQLTFCLDKRCESHFNTYRNVNGVQIVDVTPRSRVRDLIASNLPDWLTNDLICRWKILDLEPPSALIEDSWPATIAEWLFPGLNECSSLEDWFLLMLAADLNGFISGTDPVSTYISENFRSLAAPLFKAAEDITSLCAELTRSESPQVFAETWLLRKVFLPLNQPDLHQVFVSAEVPHEEPRDRVLARPIPLVFPLPDPLHNRVSKTFCEAMHRSRMMNPSCFEDVVLKLNAVWDGITSEMKNWLTINSSLLTAEAATHLKKMPGYKANKDKIQELVALYEPVEAPPSFRGISEGFNSWVAGYATFVKSSFVRRESIRDNDPAAHFSRWLKDNYRAIFEHEEVTYKRVADRIKKALREDRIVIVAMIDALAIHLSPALTRMIDSELRVKSETNYLLTPIPTITSICKEPVLTGLNPNKCNGSTKQQLCRAYGLNDDEVLVAKDWQAASELQIASTVRLVVYLDNRVDNRLHQSESYRELTEDSEGFFQRISDCLSRWVSDVHREHDESPLLIVTADHGFTFGPPPSSETSRGPILSSEHRYQKISGVGNEGPAKGDGATLIRKESFSISDNYLVATSRQFGSESTSGWKLSHGGMLPEEAIIPEMVWFSNQDNLKWPRIKFIGDAEIGADSLSINYSVTNEHFVRSCSGVIEFSLIGHGDKIDNRFRGLDPGESDKGQIKIPVDLTTLEDVSKLPLIAEMCARETGGPRLHRKAIEHQVSLARRLVEKTSEQDDFESMFE